MLSKEEAERAADALTAEAIERRNQKAERSTRGMIRLYPGLAEVPPLERHATLAVARELASQSSVSTVMLVVVTLVLGAAAAWALTGRFRLSALTFFVAMVVAIARQFVEILLMRRWLRERRRD